VRITAFFGVGNIIKDRKTNMVYFVVSSLADLTNVIIPHFLEYPLLTPLAYCKVASQSIGETC
jgi:hypothetical protein